MSFEDFQLEVADFSKKLERVRYNHFEDIIDLITDALKLMERDIYLPSMFTDKDRLLAKVPDCIEKFMGHLHVNVEMIVTILKLLSTDNIKLKYDAPWIHEERHTLFKEVILKIYDKLPHLLEKNRDVVSVSHLTQAMHAISVWGFPPDTALVELLTQMIETRVEQKAPYTSSEAYEFLDGMLRLPSKPRHEITSGRQELFAILAESALPLLLVGDAPMKMFPIVNLNLSRISRLKRLLPHPDLSKHQQVLFLAMDLMQVAYGYVHMNELYSWLPAAIVPHHKLLVALDKMEVELFQESDRSSLKWYGKQSYRKGNKTYFSTDVYVRQIKQLHKARHRKGTQWIVTRFSHAIVSNLQGDRITYTVKDIKDYLKTLRQCIWDINIDPIITVIARLCEESVKPSHLPEIDSALAVDLLWINMVLSVATGSETTRYSIDNQRLLFSKISAKDINQEQARALFEIRVMQWHGKTPFSKELLLKMQTHKSRFSESTNASAEEAKCFAYIQGQLPARYKSMLIANHICKKSGHEIDIACIARKVAIHIDGPSHTDPVTHKRTIKTLFRDKCLEKAGWVSFVVDLRDAKSSLEQAACIVPQLVAILDKDADKPLHHSQKPKAKGQVQTTSILKKAPLKYKSVFFRIIPNAEAKSSAPMPLNAQKKKEKPAPKMHHAKFLYRPVSRIKQGATIQKKVVAP